MKDGFSVITSMYRRECIENLINNFEIQEFENKELIVIINNDDIQISEFDKYVKNNENIRVYKLPTFINLGICLNYGISEAKYKYVAKFDDDDFYTKYYLEEAYKAFIREDCDVVGKWQYLIFLEGENKILKRPKEPNISRQYEYVRWLPGATHCYKKEIFDKIKFSDVNKHVDDDIMAKCTENNMKMYSTSRYNFMAFRKLDVSHHTWKISHDKLIESCDIVEEDITLDDAILFMERRCEK